jgi:hypothetical protein
MSANAVMAIEGPFLSAVVGVDTDLDQDQIRDRHEQPDETAGD